MKLKTRIMSSQLTMAIVPALLITAVLLWTTKRGFTTAVSEAEKGLTTNCEFGKKALTQQGSEDLSHIAGNVHAMCVAQQELLQQKLEGDLQVAMDILARSGGFALGTDTVTWQATNQAGGTAQSVTLPRCMVGDTWLGQISDIKEKALVVDDLRRMVGDTCTIFQRMNPAGDMLRVCTNVQKKDGTRAIGTYIPATDTGGANPIIASVLRGSRYAGRAFVVDAWCLTAYEPLKDAAGEVIGMLYVGVKEESAASLRKAIMAIRPGKTGYVYVLNATGNTRGHYVISKDGKRDGENIWEIKGPDGDLFVQDICKLATGLKPGEVGELRHYWKNADDPAPRMKIDKIAYFAPWDWVIGVGSYEDEFYEPVKQMEAEGQKVMGAVRTAQASAAKAVYTWSGGIGGATLVIASLIALAITRGVAGPLTRIISHLDAGADQVHAAAGQVSAASQQLAEGASEQASSLEETSSALEEMAAMTRTNAGNAKEANTLAARARTAADQGDKTVVELNAAMTAINNSSEKISKIIKVIEEIAFQTNLLALNAAVEAARAGEHGKGFAVVADEVRNLAQRAAQAARETTGLIEDAVNRAHGGTQVANQVGQVLGSIVTDVGKVSELIDGIARASEEQAQGVDQVNTAVSQMDKVTQQNAAGAEESASAAEQLAAQAMAVKSVVGELVQLMNGDRTTAAAPEKPVATTPRKPTAPRSGGKAAPPPVKADRPTSAPPAKKAEAFLELEDEATLTTF